MTPLATDDVEENEEHMLTSVLATTLDHEERWLATRTSARELMVTMSPDEPDMLAQALGFMSHEAEDEATINDIAQPTTQQVASFIHQLRMKGDSTHDEGHTLEREWHHATDDENLIEISPPAAAANDIWTASPSSDNELLNAPWAPATAVAVNMDVGRGGELFPSPSSDLSELLSAPITAVVDADDAERGRALFPTPESNLTDHLTMLAAAAAITCDHEGEGEITPAPSEPAPAAATNTRPRLRRNPEEPTVQQQQWLNEFKLADECDDNERRWSAISEISNAIVSAAIINKPTAPINAAQQRPNTSRPFQQRRRQYQPVYCPKAAAEIQKMYRINRKKGARKILQDRPEHCQISKYLLTQFMKKILQRPIRTEMEEKRPGAMNVSNTTTDDERRRMMRPITPAEASATDPN